MSPDSPLQFAKKFARFKSELSELSSSDRLILKWLSFWPELSPHLDNRSYKSYIEEYVGIAESIIQPDHLHDLYPAELKELSDAITELKRAVSDKLKTQIDAIANRRAELMFCLGEIETALKILAENDNTSYDIEIDYSPGQDEYSLFEQVFSKAGDNHPKLYQRLKDIKDNWDADREGVYYDRINCLFVEKDERGRNARGRLRTLTGSVEITNKRSPEDHVSYNNEIKSPDDPFVGVAYNSLKATRSLLARQGLKRLASRKLHAHLEIRDSDQKFTGNSVGAGVAVLAYIQLIRPEIRRELRYISGLMALTGGINEFGAVVPVNDDTIINKIESAFYSTVKYVVVPKGNEATARSVRDKLEEKYPHRNLILLSVSHLNEILCNLNLIREEKVCIGDFLAQKTVRYARMTKIQVPLLLILTYLLVCLVYPKAWIGFDWNPENISASGHQFIAYNRKGDLLWKTDSLEYQLSEATYRYGNTKYDNRVYFENIDQDKWDEFFVAISYKSRRCAKLNCYDHDGKLLWSVPTFKQTSYPGDQSYSGYCVERLDYYTLKLMPWHDSIGQPYILTISDCSPPARNQIMLFDANGDIVSGPYVNTGQLSPFSPVGLFDLNNDGFDEVYAGFFNNQLDKASLVFLNPLNLEGISPPYDSEAFILSGMKKGTHLRYITFPKLIDLENWHCRNTIAQFKSTNNGGFAVGIAEAMGLNLGNEVIGRGVKSNVPVINYAFDSLINPEGYYFPEGVAAKLKNISSKLPNKNLNMKYLYSAADSIINIIDFK